MSAKNAKSQLKSPRVPLFIKIPLFVSYKVGFIYILVFEVFYAGSLLLASNFQPFNSSYGIFKDAYVFVVLFGLPFSIYVVESSLKQIFKLIPELSHDSLPKRFQVERSLESLKFNSLLKESNLKTFKERLIHYSYSRWEYTFSSFLIILYLIDSYNSWWSMHGLLRLGRVDTNVFANVATFSFLILTFIFAFIIGSVFWYFTVIVVFLANIRYLAMDKNKPSQENENLDTNTKIFPIVFEEYSPFNINPSIFSKDSLTHLSYSKFYLNARCVGDFVLALTLKSILILTLFSLLTGFNNLVAAKSPNILSIIFLIVIGIIALILFFFAQIGLHRTLNLAKRQSLDNLEQLFIEQQNIFYLMLKKEPISNTLSKTQTIPTSFDDVQKRLEILESLINKESSISDWFLDLPILSGIFLTVISPIIPSVLTLLIQSVS